MPKKTLTILCISLLLLFHYGRMINYWGCELVHSTINTNTTCDCEKQSKEANNDAQQSSSQKTVRDNTEDFFADHKDLSASTFSIKTDAAKTTHVFNLSAGINSAIFQPPRF
jgi:hypothetical protein